MLNGSSSSLIRSLPSTCRTLCSKEIRYLQKQRYLPLEFCPKLGLRKNFATARRQLSTTVTSSLHWASTFVLRTVMGVTQRVARVHLHQLRLVNSQHWWPVATAADTGGRQWRLTVSAAMSAINRQCKISSQIRSCIVNAFRTWSESISYIKPCGRCTARRMAARLLLREPLQYSSDASNSEPFVRHNYFVDYGRPGKQQLTVFCPLNEQVVSQSHHFWCLLYFRV